MMCCAAFATTVGRLATVSVERMATFGMLMIGADMNGIYYSDMLGYGWETRNDGMIVDTFVQNSYVQDLYSFEYDGHKHHFAATLGGIFHAADNAMWLAETPPSADEALVMAGAVESRSEHPIATAIATPVADWDTRSSVVA